MLGAITTVWGEDYMNSWRSSVACLRPNQPEGKQGEVSSTVGLDWVPELPHLPVVAAPQSGARSRPSDATTANVSRRLKAFLRTLNMSIYQISQGTARAASKGTRAYIRDAFHAEIESGWTPDIHQVAALARLTGYRFVDWLELFGYPVNAVPHLQLLVATERTVLLPTTIYDPAVPVQYIRRLDKHVDLKRTQSLVTLIADMGCAPIGVLDRLNRRRFQYARVGRRDDMMRPLLAAGSIVRVDSTNTTVTGVVGPGPVYLVEHRGGLCCCYVKGLDHQHVVLLPDDGGSRVMRCRMGAEVRILGTIDLEFRPVQTVLTDLTDQPLNDGRQNGARDECQNRHRLPPLESMTGCSGAGQYARAARERIGLRFREAERITHQIAAYFDNRQYKIALGSLSDGETKEELPRHISKILGLSIAYSMDLWQYLRAGGITADELNGALIPRRFIDDENALSDRRVPAPRNPGSDELQAMGDIIAQLGEVPLSLLRSVGPTIGQEELSVDDVYLWGSREPVLHPILQRAILVIVNRRHRRVPDARLWLPVSRRPLLLIRTRAGRLLAGMCVLDGTVLLMHPHSAVAAPTMVFQRRDVEVIGAVSGVLRTIGCAAGSDRSTAP
jgi:hypothetical protein